MDEEVTHLLLSGITTKEFMVFYLMGILGVTIRFLADLWMGIKTDKKTPYKFSWRYFWKGFLRVVLSLMVLAIVIARFQEFSHHLVDVDFKVPTRLAEGDEMIIGMTAGTAIGLGLAIDEVLKKLVGIVKKT